MLCFDHIHPFPTSSYHHTLFRTHPTLCSLFCFKPIKSNVYCPCILGYVALQLERSQPNRSDTDSPLPAEPMAPHGRGALCFPPPRWDFGLASACMGLLDAVIPIVSSWLQLSCCVQKPHFLVAIHPLWLLGSSHPIFHKGP